MLADNYQGRKFNSPDGVIGRPDNTIWFTDHSYGIMGDNEARAGPKCCRLTST